MSAALKKDDWVNRAYAKTKAQLMRPTTVNREAIFSTLPSDAFMLARRLAPLFLK
jgi:hypothetical protein